MNDNNIGTDHVSVACGLSPLKKTKLSSKLAGRNTQMTSCVDCTSLNPPS
jgi:hypothetical protein